MKILGLDNVDGRGFHKQNKAFTLIDLVAVIAVMAVLTFMMLPALARIKGKSGAISCMNNLKRLTLATQVYSTDNRNWIPPNSFSSSAWIDGSTSLTLVNEAPGATNVDNIRSGLLFSYVKSVSIYRCPADRDILLNGIGQPVGLRVRDYSLNAMMGNNQGYVANVHPGITENRKFSDIRNPGPSMASFFFEEQGGTTPANTSIDDGLFAVETGGSGNLFSWNSSIWRNVPSSRHGNYAQLSFADGHVDKLRWTLPSTRNLKGPLANSGTINNADKKQLWLTTYASGSITGVPW